MSILITVYICNKEYLYWQQLNVHCESKKTCHSRPNLKHNFGNCWLILDVRCWMLSLFYSPINLQHGPCYISHLTLSMLLHYLAKLLLWTCSTFSMMVFIGVSKFRTRDQSNLTKSASRGPIPRLGVTPGGRKLYHWIPGVGFPISVS